MTVETTEKDYPVLKKILAGTSLVAMIGGGIFVDDRYIKDIEIARGVMVSSHTYRGIKDDLLNNFTKRQFTLLEMLYWEGAGTIEIRKNCPNGIFLKDISLEEFNEFKSNKQGKLGIKINNLIKSGKCFE